MKSGPTGLSAGASRRLAAALVFLSPLAAPSPSWAEFGSPTPLSDAEARASGSALALDPANNAFVLSAVEDTLELDLIGPALRESFALPHSGAGCKDPAIIGNSVGTMFAAFTMEIRAGNHDVFLTSNIGGRFQEPRNISLHAQDDREPHMALDRDGNPHFVWTRIRANDPANPRLIYRGPDEGAQAVDLGVGWSPSLAFDRSGRRHLLYGRGDRLYYRADDSGTRELGEEEMILGLQAADGTTLRLGVDDLGNVIVLFASRGELRYMTRGSGEATFSSPIFIDGGDVSDPEMALRAGGVITIVYAKAGDIWVVQGISGFLLAPERAAPEPTEEIESDPNVAVDNCGNLHVSFLRGAEIYYTNNSAEISADFAATPTTGQGPLPVQFQDLSNGKVQIWNWDFGDGTHSSLANPQHTYLLPGLYSVTLTVFSADRESTLTKEEFVFVQESNNTMEIPSQRVLPDQRGVWFPVRASHIEPIEGFQINAHYDPNILILDRCSFEHSAVRSLTPEFIQCNYFDERRVEIGVVFELTPPFLGRELPPGTKQTLVNLIFDVSNGAPPGVTEVRMVNNRAISRIFNIFTINGQTVLPVLKPSRVQVLDPLEPPLPGFFLRGDADGSGRVDITDAIRILNFLFLGGDAPVCSDAADVSDTGRLDIGASIYLLNYLFLGGSGPAVPFPNEGIDPTDDSFPPCN